MADDGLVKGTILAWEGSDSPDVMTYILYITDKDVPIERQADGTVAGAQKFNMGKPVPDADGKMRVDLAKVTNMTSDDGVYNLGLVAMDDAQNESSFMLIPDVPLDFLPPNAPKNGVIERP